MWNCWTRWINATLYYSTQSSSGFRALIFVGPSLMESESEWLIIDYVQAKCSQYIAKVCQWLVTGRWFSPGTPVSSTNKTDHHDITEKLLKVALNTIILTLNPEEDWVE
jgi:hypothetical protein